MTHEPQASTPERPELIGGALDECLRDCRDCEAECLSLIGRAAEKDLRLLEALLDCADACQVSARFLMRGSDAHALFCGACAEVCFRCAEECGRHQDEEAFSRCAEKCRQCAESCRQMAGQSAAV